MQLGHKVVVVTHAFKDRVGVRYMTNGLKVYYLPVSVMHDQIILPTMVSFFAVFRNILIRERISIVHGHQSTSPFAMEAILYARTLGYRACFTEHSLFGFHDPSG
jgi:phosphatidylinositol glycan class A protein